MLSSDEIKRYDRHLRLDAVGMQGQKKLKYSKVLVIGAGGLGCPILQYLTAAGVGTIGIVDGDDVDITNLQRQVLYSSNDVGFNKAKVARKQLSSLNPSVIFKTYSEFISSKNALGIISQYDFVIDGSDNFPTRYLVNDACIIENKPLVFGSIFKFEGQVSVFNYKGGPSYRCLYPVYPTFDEVPNCSEIGVLGVLPGQIGTIMAAECLKMILEIGEVLSGKMVVINVLNNSQIEIEIERRNNNFTRTILEDDYQLNCEIEENNNMVRTIESLELKAKLDKGENINILDVRELFEFEICSIDGSVLIPMNTIPARFNEIDKETPTAVICHHGMRSARVIEFLQEQGFKNLYNLTGGIHAWSIEVDTDMAKY